MHLTPCMLCPVTSPVNPSGQVINTTKTCHHPTVLKWNSVRMWKLFCINSKTPLPNFVQELLPFVDIPFFPNIHTALKIFGTIPVTTCSCERSISTLRRLKTFIKSTMGEKRLTTLALLNVHRMDRFALNADPIDLLIYDVPR